MILDDSRRADLLNLLELNGDLGELRKRVAIYPWDTDKELIELKPAHIVNVLTRFIKNDLSSTAVDDWANAIECREDIAFDGPLAEAMIQAIHELANRDLGYPLTLESAEAMIRTLDDHE